MTTKTNYTFIFSLLFALSGCTSFEQKQNSKNKPLLPKLKTSIERQNNF